MEMELGSEIDLTSGNKPKLQIELFSENGMILRKCNFA
jgi:hypothetical protein